MLEQQTILLFPPKSTRRWSIVHGDNRAPLGWAHWTGGYLSGHVLEVREQEEDPLVFTVRRAWSVLPRRLIHDAEGRYIGAVLGSRVENAKGRLLIRRAWHKDRRYSAFMSLRGEEIAEVAPRIAGYF